jgi:outer membrane protein assembly factor BamD
MEKTVKIFDTIEKSAPYSNWAPQAQFKVGVARAQQQKYDEAVRAYTNLIERYPNDDLADDAQYQIGYTWYIASLKPEYDQSAVKKAVQGFQDFLTRYPNSEKVSQAQSYMVELQGRGTQGSYKIARFYEKQGNLKAAVIYYNDVIQQDPESDQGREAKEKVSQLEALLNRPKKPTDKPVQTAEQPTETEKKS